MFARVRPKKKKTEKRERMKNDMRKKGRKNEKNKMKFHRKKGPKTGTTQGQLRGQKRGKKRNGKIVVAPKSSLGGPRPTMKETFLQENNCTSKTKNKNKKVRGWTL